MASILLAFGIDAWWDSRSNLSRAAELLDALESEWTTELSRIEGTLDSGAEALSAIEASIEIFRGTDKEPTPEIASDLLARMSFGTYKPSLGAVNSVLLSDLSNIRDGDLRLAIASWSSVLDEIAPEQSVILQAGLVDLRRAFARVALAQSLESTASGSTRISQLDGELSLAALRDEEFVVVLVHLYDVTGQYLTQLGDIRDTLIGNLHLLRDR